MAVAVGQVQVEPLSSPNEGISVVSLTRSSAKNAIGRQLLRELQEVINTLRQERTTRVVVLRSACPGTFSAGADLKVLRTQAADSDAEPFGEVTCLQAAWWCILAPMIHAFAGARMQLRKFSLG
jgi:methylglutaconyl-CoA hydratase